MGQEHKILVAGVTGQVARSLALAKAPAGMTVINAGRPELDLLDGDTVREAIERHKPDIVVNAAAYTAVDQAESDEDAAFALNAAGPGRLAAVSAERAIPIIHISTDYVFDGTKNAPYAETDPVAPLGVYGRSKLAGEEEVAAANPAHFILRTAWVYSPFGKNFVKTMLRVGAGRDELNVVDDQRGNPTSALDIAQGILTASTKVLSGDPAAAPGVYHMSGTGEATWADFASFIFECSHAIGGPSAAVNRITSAEFPTPVKRPANSRLDCQKFAEAFDVRLPDWRDSARECVETLILSGEWNS